MDAKNFFNTVEKMRAAQKAYFAARRQCRPGYMELEESRKLEKIVDAEIERVRDIEKNGAGLFND